MEGRVMGLDVGDARTGVALSDLLRIIATPHSVIPMNESEDPCAAIAALAAEQEVAEIVVGLPLNQSGEVGSQAEKVLAFIERLKKQTTLPIVTQDERFSTATAERALVQANVSRKKRKGIVDKVAAQQILQLYLDRRAHQRGEAR